MKRVPSAANHEPTAEGHNSARTTAQKTGAVALRQLRETVPVGDPHEELEYLATLLTSVEIAHLSNSSLRGIEAMRRRARDGTPPARTTKARIAISKTVAVLEHMENNLECEPANAGDFLRSYVIDPESREALSMLDLIRDDRVPEVVERAELIFPSRQA